MNTDQSPCTVVEAVRQDLLDRSRVGQSKYGTTLGNAGLSRREILQHAYEEALDLANYLKTEIMRLDAKPPKIVGTLYGRPVTEGDIISASQYADVEWDKQPYTLTEQKPSERVACEDTSSYFQSAQEMGWTKVGNKGWRKGKVTINVQWQPFNRKDMILVNDGVTTYYATDMTDAFKMGERLL